MNSPLWLQISNQIRDDGKPKQHGIKSEDSEAREGEDDTVSVNTEASESSNETEAQYQTKSGRGVRQPTQLTTTKLGKWGMGVSAAKIWLMQAYQLNDDADEVHLIGATGEGFTHTTELHVMNYKQAMQSVDAAAWQVEVDKEHDRMIKNWGCYLKVPFQKEHGS